VIEEETLEVITSEVVSEQTGEEEQKSGFFTDFLASFSEIWASIVALKYHILGVVGLILLIYVLVKTKAHKKIIEFFEEEIEEEKVPILGKKEEPKEEKKVEEHKKEEPKEEPKKAAKKPAKKTATKKKELNEDTEDELEIKGLDEESDKEDFIIEFDDEEDKK